MTDMPPQYTRIPNKYKAPWWAGPNLYWNPLYLQWRQEQDALRPVPYSERHFDADEATGTEDNEWQEPTVAQLDPYFKPTFNAWVGDPAKKRRTA